jgi:predicted lipoprotein with Yx(FWY)xxD motif
MRNPRTAIAIIAVAAVTTVGGVTIAATAGGSTPRHSAAAALHTTTATVQGATESILVDAKGRPLYIYKPDTATKSRVTGQLAALWPPLVASAPTAQGATGSLTAVATANGQQVAYNGHFLYTFVEDSPGHVTGQGVQNFFVATPGISIKASTNASTTAVTTRNGY